MIKKQYPTLFIFSLLMLVQCKGQITIDGQNFDNTKTTTEKPQAIPTEEKEIIVGAENHTQYLPLLEGKRIAVVTNQTGIIPSENNQHLVDFLIENQIEIKKIFSPEHGFRGKADAGEKVKNGIDTQTGLPIVSLYGKNKKPGANQTQDIDVFLFDIQDVGVRFYTYISTLHYIMEAAAENGKQVLVLDRPNPNGHYIDGPVLEPKQSTFVGMHPVPIVYGMTIGEYAQMINGEHWLKNGIQADLTVIPLQNYHHKKAYSLPVKPSPNLPNDRSINLYPSICFFEGTNVSEGRGTNKQFQVWGSPYQKIKNYSFTPHPNEGAKNPQHNGKFCYGMDLSHQPPLNEINLEWLILAYKNNTQTPFFTKNSGAFWLDKLAGTSALRHQIQKGMSEKEIKATWQEGLNKFKEIRKKYLMYP